MDLAARLPNASWLFNLLQTDSFYWPLCNLLPPEFVLYLVTVTIKTISCSSLGFLSRVRASRPLSSNIVFWNANTAAPDVMERCSGGEMWFESPSFPPRVGKWRSRTKFLNGGYQTRLRPLMCWSLLSHSSGTREQNIGGFSEAQEAPGMAPRLVWSGGSFSPPLQYHGGITGSILDTSMGLMSTPLSKQPRFQQASAPVLPAASPHLMHSWETLVWSSASRGFSSLSRSCPQSTEQLRYVSISLKVYPCHWKKEKASRFLHSCLCTRVCVCPCVSCFSMCLSCQLLSENIPKAYGQGILIISGGVSNAGRRPSIPLMYHQSKKTHPPLIYLEMERMGENDLELRGRCIHWSIPLTHHCPNIYLAPFHV